MHLGSLIRSRAASGLPAIALAGPDEPEIVTWREVALASGRVASSLLACGLEPREAVAFLTVDAEEALPAVFGTWLAGGIATFVDPGGAPDLIAARLAHAESRIVFAHGDRVAAAQGPGRVVVLPADLGASPHGDSLEWDDFLRLGQVDASGARDLAERRCDELTAGDVACYAFHGGQVSGAPVRASKLTHGAVIAGADALAQSLDLAGGDRILSWIAPHHVLRRSLEVAACLASAALCASRDFARPSVAAPGGPQDAWGRTRPTILCAPYAEIEILARTMLRGDLQAGALARRVWDWAIGTAIAETRRKNPARTRSWRGLLARKLGLDEARDGYGGALRQVVCTGGSVSRLAQEVLRALGIATMPLYALTEAAGAVAAVSLPEPAWAGVVGSPVAGVGLQLSDAGEVMWQGTWPFAGYLKEPAATDRATLGGWFRTGDRGAWDGPHLRLLGPVGHERGLTVRVDAVDVECGLRDRPAIADALAVPTSPWTALLVPDPGLVAEIAARSALPADAAPGDPRVEEAVRAAVEAYNGGAGFEGRVAAYAIVPVLPHRAMGTVDRHLALEWYADRLDQALPVRYPDLL